MQVADNDHKGVNTVEFKYRIIDRVYTTSFMPGTFPEQITLVFVGKAYERVIPQSYITIPLRLFMYEINAGHFAPVSRDDVFWEKQDAQDAKPASNAKEVPYVWEDESEDPRLTGR